jgi:phasin family protein
MSITTATKTAESRALDLKQGVAYATTATADASDKAMKTAKDLAAFNQASLEAFTQAGKVLTAGTQDLFRQMAASTQSAFAEVMSGFQALASAKTVKERLELQASFARASATRAVAEGGRFAQASIDLVEKASGPLTARVALAAETFATPKV